MLKGPAPAKDFIKMIQLHSSILYSLSDSSMATALFTLLGQNVRVFHSNLANLFGALLRINSFFVSTPQNVDFAQ